MRKLAAFLAVVSTGCTTLEPAYVQPNPAIPASWPAGDAYLKQSEATLPAVTYQEVFRDPRLQTLIAQALENNRDLMIAAANIAAAREQYHIQRANQLPEVNAAGSANVTTRDNGSGLDVTYAAGVQVPSFELDLFGRIRSLSHVRDDGPADATRIDTPMTIKAAILDGDERSGG